MIYLTLLVAFVHFLYKEEGNFSVDPQFFFFFTLEQLSTLKSVKPPEILRGSWSWPPPYWGDFHLGRDLQLPCNVISGLKIPLCSYPACDATRKNILACEMPALADHMPLNVKSLFASFVRKAFDNNLQNRHCVMFLLGYAIINVQQ